MKHKKTIKKLEEDIIELKQLLEQSDLRANKAEMYVEEHFPAVSEIEIKQGWHSGSGTSTFDVKISVFADDLHKIIKFLTNRKMKEKKWSHIHSDITEQIEKEVKKQYGITDQNK